MRDPNRIEPMLQALGDLWRKYPDLRLGQLLLVVIGSNRSVKGLPDGFTRNPLFHVEDDEVLASVTATAERWEKWNKVDE